MRKAIGAHKQSYSRFTLNDPYHTSVPQTIQAVYPQASEWNPAVYPQDHMECVSFVVMAYQQ